MRNVGSIIINPSKVKPSKHSIFVRFFRPPVKVDDVKDFFSKQCDGQCKVDFFSISKGDELAVAIRFDSTKVAKQMLEKYNKHKILGCRVDITWFKDIRKARKKGGRPFFRGNAYRPFPPGRGRWRRSPSCSRSRFEHQRRSRYVDRRSRSRSRRRSYSDRSRESSYSTSSSRNSRDSRRDDSYQSRHSDIKDEYQHRNSNQIDSAHTSKTGSDNGVSLASNTYNQPHNSTNHVTSQPPTKSPPAPAVDQTTGKVDHPTGERQVEVVKLSNEQEDETRSHSLRRHRSSRSSSRSSRSRSRDSSHSCRKRRRRSDSSSSGSSTCSTTGSIPDSVRMISSEEAASPNNRAGWYTEELNTVQSKTNGTVTDKGNFEIDQNTTSMLEKDRLVASFSLEEVPLPPKSPLQSQKITINLTPINDGSVSRTVKVKCDQQTTVTKSATSSAVSKIPMPIDMDGDEQEEGEIEEDGTSVATIGSDIGYRHDEEEERKQPTNTCNTEKAKWTEKLARSKQVDCRRINSHSSVVSQFIEAKPVQESANCQTRVDPAPVGVSSSSSYSIGTDPVETSDVSTQTEPSAQAKDAVDSLISNGQLTNEQFDSLIERKRLIEAIFRVDCKNYTSAITDLAKLNPDLKDRLTSSLGQLLHQRAQASIEEMQQTLLNIPSSQAPNGV